MISSVKNLKALFLAAGVVALAGCNENAKDCGGFWDKTFGREACTAVTRTSTQTASLAANVNVVADTETQSIVSTVVDDTTGNTQITVPADSPIATTPVGNIVMIAGGKESRFPLGLTGRVLSVQDVAGGKAVEVKPVTLMEAFDKLDVAFEAPITADNIIGVVSPFDLQPTTPVPAVAKANGVSKKASSPITRSASTSAANLSCLNAKDKFVLLNPAFNQIKLGEVTKEEVKSFDDTSQGFEFKVSRPFFDADCDPKTDDDQMAVEFTLKMDNAVAKTDVDLDKSDVKDPLKSAKLEFKGTIEGGLKFTGKADFDTDSLIGSSAVWEQFEKSTAAKLGQKVEINGLNADDKKGKIPLAGIVIQPRPTGLFHVSVAGGDNAKFSRTLKAASVGGGVLWVYLNSNMEVSVEGEFGVDMKSSVLHFGMDAKSDGNGSVSATPYNTVSPVVKTTEGALRIPYFKGSISGTQTFGFNLDADVFILGIRPLTASAFVGEQANLKIEAESAYQTNFDGRPFSLTQKGCLSGNIGAGAKFQILGNIGATVNMKVAGYASSFNAEKGFEFNYPAKDDGSPIVTQGWTGLWYNFLGAKDSNGEGQDAQVCVGVAELKPHFTYQQLPIYAMGSDVNADKYYPASFDISQSLADWDLVSEVQAIRLVVDNGVPYEYKRKVNGSSNIFYCEGCSNIAPLEFIPAADDRVIMYRFDRPGDHVVTLELEGSYHRKVRYTQTVKVATAVIAPTPATPKVGEVVSLYLDKVADVVLTAGQKVKTVVWSVLDAADEYVLQPLTAAYDSVVETLFDREGNFRLFAEVKDEADKLVAYVTGSVTVEACNSSACTAMSISGVSPGSLVVGEAVTVHVSGENIPASAVFELAGATCGAPFDVTGFGLSQSCTPTVAGSQALTLRRKAGDDLAKVVVQVSVGTPALPEASLVGSSITGVVGQPVTFVLSNSKALQGTLCSFHFDNGQGLVAGGGDCSDSGQVLPLSSITTMAYTAAGTYTASLTVVDSQGRSGMATWLVNVVESFVDGSVGKLNDTGITQCANDNSWFADCTAVTMGGWFGLNQDAQTGRDALVAQGQLSKVGGGDAGFDFTKISATGQPLPANATEWSCVKDNHTGLMWEVKTDDGGLHDKDNRYTWYNPDNGANGGFVGYQDYDDYRVSQGLPARGYGRACGNSLDKCNTKSYAIALNENNFCGYNDWRLSNIQELLSIVNFGKSDPAVDSAYFPNILANFSSSDPQYDNNEGVWSISFYDGQVTGGTKHSSSQSALFVRSGP